MRSRPDRNPGLGPRRMFRGFPHRPLFRLPRMRMLRQGSFTLCLLDNFRIAIKLHDDDLRCIEAYTGKRMGELGEAELINAMRDLGISNRHVSHEELKVSKAMRRTTMEDLELLEKLTQMYYNGFLTADEYGKKKAQILGLK